MGFACLCPDLASSSQGKDFLIYPWTWLPQGSGLCRLCTGAELVGEGTGPSRGSPRFSRARAPLDMGVWKPFPD